jgi:hypothetical protein
VRATAGKKLTSEFFSCLSPAMWVRLAAQAQQARQSVALQILVGVARI